MRQTRTKSKLIKMRELRKAHKWFIFFLIFIFITHTSVQSIVNGQVVVKKDSPNLDIQVEEGATKEKSVITVTSDQPVLENTQLQLPKKVTLSEEETNNLNGQYVVVEYDKRNHIVYFHWKETVDEQKAMFVLTDLQDKNDLIVTGMINDEVVAESNTSFTVEESVVQEKEKASKTENSEQTVQEEKKTKKNEEFESTSTDESITDESIDEEPEKEEKRTHQKNQSALDEEAKVKEEEKDQPSTNEKTTTITPFAGNLNMDIDLSPYKETVESGNAAMYNLVFKTTGSQKEYTNAKLVIELPITHYSEFTQEVKEIKIAGTTPIYDGENHTLTYHFETLKTGQTYDVLLKVDTKNGYSPDDAELEARALFEADEADNVQDEATVVIKSSSAITINKRFTGEVWDRNEWAEIPAKPGQITKWEIKVEIPKKETGQMYLKEGSKIVVTDTLPSGLTFDSAEPAARQEGNKLIWEFDAPTVEEQENAEGNVFTKTIELWLVTKAGTENTFQTNTADVKATLIDENINVEESEDSIYIYKSDSNVNRPPGTYYIPVHWGPLNGKGETIIDKKGDSDSSEEWNPRPVVYDDALLKFELGIAPRQEGQFYDFERLSNQYHIDPNLNLEGIITPGEWVYDPYSGFYEDGAPRQKLERNPEFDIYANVNGRRTLLVQNAESGKHYTREELGLSTSDHVSYIDYYFTYAPTGLLSHNEGEYYFTVQKGYVGKVENYHIFSGRGGHSYGRWGNRYYDPRNFTYDSRNTSDIFNIPEWTWPRQAIIAKKPENAAPIATVGVSLQDHSKGIVVNGSNRMEVNLNNLTTSPYSMNKDLQTVVLLPPGVKVSDVPNVEYSNNEGGTFEVIDHYNGTGRQLVTFTWNEDYLRYDDSLKAWIDIEISDNAPAWLYFDVYGFSGNDMLKVPATSGYSVTDTILQTDEDDLNGDGITDRPRLKSGNIYTIRGQYDLQTEKWVKGQLDDDWTYFGQTVPGGTIEYKLNLTNTTGKDISIMTLIDVLPSVGDLGITDNVARGSKFTPLMTGPITLPAEWQDKVNVYYSTTKNPKRDDLIRNTKYPETTTPLSNPEGAEDPNWVTEDNVSDWSNIHSLKIELSYGETWIKGADMDVLFTMQAPEAKDVGRDVLDEEIDPHARAACNSFAVATEHGQPIEPYQVCTYMNYDIEEPEVEKTVNGQKETWELINRDETFTWEVDYKFGNYTNDWESVQFRDEIHELLEIENVQLLDQNGLDVNENGDLDVTDNVVVFTLNKQDGSFAYLQGQTYTLIIQSKIKETATNEDLLPFIQSGGIPNEAQLVINDEPKTSNEVKVKPPKLEGSLKVIKVDKELDDEGNKIVLAGAEFELRDENGEVVATRATDEDGRLSFEDLPLGKYQLIETKAPEGYRLLKKPLEVEITADHLEVQLEVENSKSDWELPKTGGIGTVLFYGLGALLMIGALLFLFKRKKTSEQTEE